MCLLNHMLLYQLAPCGESEKTLDTMATESNFKCGHGNKLVIDTQAPVSNTYGWKSQLSLIMLINDFKIFELIKSYNQKYCMSI